MEITPPTATNEQTTNVGWIKNAGGEWESPLHETPNHQSELGEWVQTDTGWARSTIVTEQTEPSVEHLPTQLDSNRELLAKSEAGVLLLSAFDAAVKTDPRLADIVVVPYDPSTRGTKGSAFARGADISESGKHEIHVRLDDLDESLELMQETLQKVPGLREMMADMLLLEDPSELTAMQLHSFVMLHEMGHLVEFMNHESNMPELRRRQAEEKAALPLGNVATSALIDPSSPGGKYVRDNWGEVQAEYGVSSVLELAKIKNLAHRNMTSEAFADNFAANVLVYEPTLLEQLGTTNLDYYRDFIAA